MWAYCVTLQGGSIHSAKPHHPVILPKYVEGTVLRSFALSNDPLEQILLRMLAEGPHYRPTLSESLVLFQELHRLY